MDETSVQVCIEESQGRRILHVKGEATMPGIFGLRQAFLDALDSGCEVVLDLQAATTIDLCGLQTICSGHRTFLKRGGSLVIGNIPEPVRTVANMAGYNAERSTCPYRSGACLWRD